MNGIRRSLWFARSVIATGLIFGAMALSGYAQQLMSLEAQLLDQMCTRGLGEAAIRYARDRRQLEQDRHAIAWWVMREMECHGQVALQSRQNSEDHWAACRQIAEDYRKSVSQSSDINDDPRWPWVQWQLGRCMLLESQLRLAWTLANPANATERETALELVRAVVALSDELQADIRHRQPLAARQTTEDASQAPAEQLRNLSADTQLLRCEAMMVRAQLYSEGSADRSASLAEVGVLARDVLDRTGNDWPMRPALQLAEATARLESGDDSAMADLQQLISEEHISPRIKMLAGVTLAQAHGRRGQLSLGTAVLDGLEVLARSAPELAAHWKFAKIEMAHWELKKLSDNRQEEALRKLVEQTKELGSQHGDYWRTRAEGLVVAKLSSRQVQDTQLAKDLLLAEVRQLTAAGQVELACEKLILARDAETLAGNGEAALELANMAAALFRHINRWQEAASAAEQTACTFHQLASAPEAHLWAIRARAEAIRSTGATTAATEAYQKSLEDHLKHWPQSSSSPEVAAWLRDLLLESSREKLIESLLAVISQVANVQAADELLSMLLEQCVLSAEPSRLEAFTKDLEARLDFTSSESLDACRAVVLSARAITDGGSLADWSTADVLRERSQLLQQWLNQFGSELPQLNRHVTLALAMDASRLGEKHTQMANDGFNQFAPEMRIAVAASIVALLDAATDSERQEFWAAAGLHAQWASSILDSESNVIDKLLRERPVSHASLARIAVQLGDKEQLDRLRQLVEQHSKNGAVRLMLANYFLHQHETEKARQLATQIAALSQPGRPLHLAARWCLVRSLAQAGQTDEAARAARLILATQPGMNQLWTQRFKRFIQDSVEP